VPGGAVSNRLIDSVRPGDFLELTRPAGVFCLGPGDDRAAGDDRAGGRPLVAFCGGSGITPVMSLAKAALMTSSRPVRLLYANRDRRSVIFADQLDRLAAASDDRLEVRYHHDSDSGLLTAEDIAASLAGWEDADFYICGPPPFMDLVESVLTDSGVDPERVFIERFGAPEPEPAGAPEVAEADPVPETVTVVINGRKHRAAYQAGQTLLETARRAGLKPPFSCESGTCATCMAIIREGTVRMRVNAALSPDEVAEGWVLTCQSLPTSAAVTVEYESL
jgi:ferredoxin-NADP reductase